MINPNHHAGSIRVKSPGAALLLLAVLAVFLVVMAALARPAQAATLHVTNTNDSGTGSLRYAINRAAPSGDTITFASNVNGTITLTSGDLQIDKNLTINGPGAGKLTVSGNNSDRVFYIADGSVVRISGLTITKGNRKDYAYPEGGGIYNDFGGNLTLTGSVVRGNYGGEGGGGGIYNYGALTVNRSTISGNATGSGDGGGIENAGGTLTVLSSTISGNTAADGGGIHTYTYKPATATIINSTISGNSATSAYGDGGGVYNEGDLTIKYSTIKNNAAPRGQGSGVDNYYATTKVFSSIIAGNKNSDVDGNSFSSQGYNLVGNGNATRAFHATGDRVGVTNPGRIVMGTQANDTLKGTSLSDIIIGGGGNDTIYGFGGYDVILGGGGNDTIYGGWGSDFLNGQSGNDVLYGQDGNDRLYGATGVDKLYGQGGNDFLNVRDSRPKDLAVGGSGTDTCRYDRGDIRRSCER